MGTWKLVYSADEQGTAQSGSLDALKTAVRRGADVKVVYPIDGEWWSRYCGSVCVLADGVTAFSMEACDLRQSGDDFLIVDPPRQQYHAYNSSGLRSRSAGDVLESTRLAIRWFVRDHNEGLFASLASIFRPAGP